MVIFAHAAGKPLVEAEFPFELRDGFIWLKVTARESSAPLSFILDSGAAVSTLNAATASRLDLHDGAQVRVSGVGATTVGYWPQRVDASVAGVRLPTRYHVVDLCTLEQVAGRRRGPYPFVEGSTLKAAPAGSSQLARCFDSGQLGYRGG